MDDDDRALGRKRNKNKITKIFPKENEMILVRQLQPKRETLAASDGINEKQEVLLKTCVVNSILITYCIARGSVTSCGYLHTIFAAVV